MTVPIALLLGLIAGSLVARLARRPLRAAPEPLKTRYGAVVAVFGAVVLTPAALALFALEPAWSLMYLIHPEHSFGLLWPGVAVALVGAPILGLKTAHGFLASDREARWWVWTGALTAGLLVGLVAGMSRLGAVAYYEVFHYDARGVPLAASSIFWPFLITGLVVPVTLAYCLVQVQRHVEVSEQIPAPAPADFPDEAGEPPA